MAPVTHALNAICPYYTMFPLSFPQSVLRRSEPHQVVVDPFCGRGTTNFAARLAGLPTHGIDSNPVAAALAEAKIANVTRDGVLDLLSELLGLEPGIPPEGEFWEMAFDSESLQSIATLRTHLMSRRSPEAVFLRALVLGALHGPLNKGRPSYFSNQCPRTFAPKPKYALKFWSERSLVAPKIDVSGVLERRLDRFVPTSLAQGQGSVIRGDSRDSQIFERLPPTKWFITSPPYYGMKTYEQDQWLRLWFLGGPETVDYAHPSSQLGHRGPDEFANDLRKVWTNLERIADTDARLVIRFGGIHDRSADPNKIIKDSLSDTNWQLKTIRSANTASMGKRQMKQFKVPTQDPRPEIDAYCSLR